MRVILRRRQLTKIFLDVKLTNHRINRRFFTPINFSDRLNIHVAKNSFFDISFNTNSLRINLKIIK